jgi:hypothetical protein
MELEGRVAAREVGINTQRVLPEVDFIDHYRETVGSATLVMRPDDFVVTAAVDKHLGDVG